ncbi:hypothetical protein SMD44_00927 [Streptomyces alboflavus]|uniref:Uncharacterized protein n=1 Tax=Streptomyces alboflavus TaxID=67267 RepID=A0A1Z1W578_9ACTN|nr:hypothetical protein [Streptomyces alboflavus]ARX81529.1 hypothetical protein SMD44_00927 [Streptomyces alboflavus]
MNTERGPMDETPISLPPGTVIGYVAGRPVFNIAGGSDDGAVEVESGDVPEDAEGDADQGDAADGGDEEAGRDEAPKPKPPAGKNPDPFTPPSEAEWRKTQAALKKANEDGKRHRLRNKELEEAARANETDHEKSLREAREQGEARFRAPLVKAAARVALREAGLSGATDRGLRLVDLDALTVDDDGEVVGLEGEIARVKDEYPEFFQADKPRPKVRPTAADRKPAEEKPKSSAEQHAMRVLGRMG